MGDLISNSTVGLHNIDQYLRYSMLFVSVQGGFNQWLNQAPAEQKIPAVSLAASNLYDSDLLYYVGFNLNNRLWRVATDVPLLPERIKRWYHAKYFPLSTDDFTPLQHAALGFWNLYKKDTAALLRAYRHFESAQHLPQATVAQSIANVLNKSCGVETLADVTKITQFFDWGAFQEAEIRLVAIQHLQQLFSIAQEATVAAESVSKLNRNAALGRATAQLEILITTVEDTCPQPEAWHIKQAALQWRSILAAAAGQIGDLTVIEPVHNPFVAGNPVKPPLFVGRDDIYKQLESLWGNAGKTGVDSVVVYGHRRMGKTSILQNLGLQRFGVQTHVANFSMQITGDETTTDRLLHYLAIAIFDSLEKNGVTALAEPEATAFARDHTLAFDRYLKQVRQAIPSQRVILAIDEFEIIEAGIEAGRIDKSFLTFIRGIMHKERWLIFALAGLHTLQEMTADYWNPLFASVTPIKVSFLSKAASQDLLANPTDDFILDFTGEVTDYVYGFTAGQPYLTQLIGRSLVSLYNQQVFEDQAQREQRFTIVDVDAVVTSSDFFDIGSFYFGGVWGQAKDGTVPFQTDLLKVLAQAETSMPVENLFERATVEATAGKAALAELIKHDVVNAHAGSVQLYVPLMAEWIKRTQF